jgi:hypothetical protein
MLERMVLLLIEAAGVPVRQHDLQQVCSCMDRRYGLDMHATGQLDKAVTKLAVEQWINSGETIRLSRDGQDLVRSLKQQSPAFCRAFIRGAANINKAFRPQEA